MSKLMLRGFTDVPAADLDAVVAELPNHVQLTLQEPGCLMFDVVQDKANPSRFDVYEEFSDEGAFERHQQRVKNSQWGEITADVVRHYEIFTKSDV